MQYESHKLTMRGKLSGSRVPAAAALGISGQVVTLYTTGARLARPSSAVTCCMPWPEWSGLDKGERACDRPGLRAPERSEASEASETGEESREEDSSEEARAEEDEARVGEAVLLLSRRKSRFIA